MTNIHKYTGSFYIIILLTSLCLLSSCTYDYFEDETNYVVYVPKADVNKRTETYKVDDVRIFIYNTDLEKDRYSLHPFEDNARTTVGNFNFKLLPGLHPVHCFSNINGVDFSDIQSYTTAKFALQKLEDGYYKEPPVILSDNTSPLIRFPGPLVTDTAWFEHKYVGRICVAIKNLQNVDPKLTFDNIKKIEVLASGVGTVQYLSNISDSINTRSSRKAADDVMRLTTTLYQNPFQDFDLGFENYYLPSPDLSSEGNSLEPIALQINFLDANNNIIKTLNVDVVDSNYEPIILHMAETVVVTIDGNNIQILRLSDPLDWNPNIETGEDNTPNGGGTEV